jgi:glucoamylase
MSRSLVLGNGSLLVGIDRFGLIRDFYYDYVGLENHMTSDSVHLVGVWVSSPSGSGNGQISWLHEGGWNIAIDYRHETLVGTTTAVNESLQLELNFQDLVYNEKTIFIRKISIKNKSDSKRSVKIFLNHQFRMYGIDSKDTVYFDPEDNTIMHYKGRRIVLIGGLNAGKSFDDYAVGLSNIEGREGTWKDAEDGVLSQNPIEHGRVDSTIAFENTLDSSASCEFYYWIAIGKTFEDVKALHKYVLKKTPQHLAETTQDFWNAWVNKTEYSFYGLDKRVSELFKKSLLIIRTHVDNTGGIIASGDSEMLQYGRDNYCYIWPRDASFAAIALDKAGYPEVSRKYFEFANDVISPEGYFFHKFRSDRSWGSSWHPWISDGIRRLPIQEDETALVICALWEHYKYSKDLEFVETVYNSLIKNAGSFMLGFRSELKLPFPTYDIWEMKFGTSTFTSAAVYAALEVVGNFAKLLGKEKDEDMFKSAALELKNACQKLFFNDKSNYFYKLIDQQNGQIFHDETLDASSFYGMFHFGAMDLDDPKLQKSFATFQKYLLLSDKAGVIRFENDPYYHIQGSPGNPWFVTTLWMVQYLIAKAQKEEDFRQVKYWFNWIVDHALPSGILSEQINPLTGEQLSAAPLIWSHAEFVTSIILYLERLEKLGIAKK